MQINFHDEQGLGWTVTTPEVSGPGGPSCTTLLFTSQSGERRTSEAWHSADVTWNGVEERTWCAFLRYSDVAAVER